MLRPASRETTGRLTLATAIIPKLAAGDAILPVTQARGGKDFTVTVGGDRLVFRQGADGYTLVSLEVAPGWQQPLPR